jgi:hypothetical protein
MSKYFLTLCLLFSVNLFAQEEKNTEAAPLTYKPEIPDSSTYKVILNQNNRKIEPDILKQINFYRKQEENFLWYVEEGLIIEILPINKIKK